MKGATFAVLGVLSIVVVVGVAVEGQLVALKRELVAARSELAATKERVGRLENWLAESRGQQGLQGGRARGHEDVVNLSGDVAAGTTLELSREAIKLLRDYIKVPPAPLGTAPTISPGAVVPEAMLVPVPPQISEKVPALNGARFTTDRNGAIVLLRKGSRRADAVVPPN